jgi:hypothetical protein
MKYIISLATALVHAAFYANFVTIAPSQQSWDTTTSDGIAKIAYHNNDSTNTVYVPNPISFSTQHRSFRHHTSAPQYNLDRMSTEQLVWYFSMCNYTEGEILIPFG